MIKGTKRQIKRFYLFLYIAFRLNVSTFETAMLGSLAPRELSDVSSTFLVRRMFGRGFGFGRNVSWLSKNVTCTALSDFG